MAKFRQNHEKQTKRKIASQSIRLMLAVGIIVMILLGGIEYLRKDNQNSNTKIENTENENHEINKISLTLKDYLPSNKDGQLVNHKYYSLSYVEKYEQAEWVAFEMFRNRENQKHVKRWKRFNVDPFVKTGSATHKDYTRSGYDRGHLVPAHALGFDSKGMKESFYMSNMTPQNHDFNSGIWRELEEQSGEWAKKYGHLVIITGPLYEEEPKLYIGKNRVAVPKFFYKVLYADNVDPPQMIGYIMPNKDSNRDVNDYAVSVDQIEMRSGIDFFPSETTSKINYEKLESTFEIDFWELNKRISKRRNKF